MGKRVDTSRQSLTKLQAALDDLGASKRRAEDALIAADEREQKLEASRARHQGGDIAEKYPSLKRRVRA